jgi:hypothetical protein
MSKPLKYTVAIVIKDAKSPDKFLLVKRPDDDPDLRGAWGLPALTAKPNELPEETARRVCREKLGCDGVPTRFLGAMVQKRNSYDICLMDIEVQLNGATSPDVAKATAPSTRYSQQKWTNQPMDLMPAAKEGSCCASIYLSSVSLLDRAKWIESLEGSSIVA